MSYALWSPGGDTTTKGLPASGTFFLHYNHVGSLNYVTNTAGEGFRDANGWPRGLLVPMDWANPIEGTFVENAYPRFNAWRTSFGTTDTDWYLTRVDSLVVMQDFFTPGSQIRNEYKGQGVVNSDPSTGSGQEALIVYIQTNGEVRYLNSTAPQYIYNGSYTYNAQTRLMHVDFTSVDLIDSTCTVDPCSILATFPVTFFAINPDYKNLRINGVADNTLSVTFIQSNTQVNFTRRSGFSPFDEVTP